MIMHALWSTYGNEAIMRQGMVMRGTQSSAVVVSVAPCCHYGMRDICIDARLSSC
jgi:pyrimidine deaminase RibD-like protein